MRTSWLILLLFLPMASADMLYLTADRGSANGYNDFLLLSPDSPNGGSEAIFVPLLEGLGLSENSQDWFSGEPLSDDMIIDGDTEVSLFFFVEVQALVEADVRLYDVDASGEQTLISSEERSISLPALLPQEVVFALDTRDYIVTEGSIFRLEVEMNGLSVTTWLRYDSTANPSAITDLPLAISDLDGDGLGDSLERSLGWNPMRADTDGDGASDFAEWIAGTDGANGSSVPGRQSDADQDGLPDDFEDEQSLDANNADSDGDGYSDGLEIRYYSDPSDENDAPLDTDGDGLPDAYEEANGLNPLLADSDGDEIPDGLEDRDGDGLSELEEAEHGTNPQSSDSDGDGKSDADEVRDGDDATTNRKDLSGAPAEWEEPVIGTALMAGSTLVVGFALTRRWRL